MSKPGARASSLDDTAGIAEHSAVRQIELQIDDVAFGGKGVGRDNGKAVFVPFTIESERIVADVVREKKNFAEAEFLQVLSASEHRATPKCPYFGRCGGCSYQHISYEHQLELKTRQVQQVLQRIGRLTDLPMRRIIPSPLPYAYRNRITVHAEDRVVGFFQRDAHSLVDVEECPIAMPEVNAELAGLRASRVRDGHYTLRAKAGARVFAQTNDAVAEAIANEIAGMIPPGQRLLIDAYCGSGFFAKKLRNRFERIIGIEWDRYAIEVAQHDAAENEKYIAGDVGTELRILFEAAEPPSTVVIVDPPATGLTNEARAALIDLRPATLIYVSCNPSTLARDLAELRAGFAIESVTPADMFPQTAEIEVLVHLSTMQK